MAYKKRKYRKKKYSGNRKRNYAYKRKNTPLENDVYLLVRFIGRNYLSAVSFIVTYYNPLLILIGVGIGNRMILGLLFTLITKIIDEFAYYMGLAQYDTNKATGKFHSAINSWRHYKERTAFTTKALIVVNIIAYVLYGIIDSFQWFIELY